MVAYENHRKEDSIYEKEIDMHVIMRTYVILVI